MALLDARGEELTLFVTNRHPRRELPATIALGAFRPGPTCRVAALTGSSFMAQNTWNEPAAVAIATTELALDGPEVARVLPAHSLIVFVFARSGR
jgi:alpha-L-arabinofuranosidase